MDKELIRKYKIVAGNNRIDDFVKLLEALQDYVSDVRNKITGHDVIETRNAINSFLKEVVDRLKGIKDSKKQQTDESSDDSV